MFNKTMIIAAVLASSVVSFDVDALAHTHHRAHGHRAFVHAVGASRGHRHGAYAVRHHGRVRRYAAARRRGIASIGSPRAASLIRNYVAGTTVGRASFYSGSGHTANGGFVGSATCAHRSLPFGTKVLVTNLANLRQAVLTVNDRGPFVGNRVLDVSRGAAGMLGMLHAGISQIRMQVVGGPG